MKPRNLSPNIVSERPVRIEDATGRRYKVTGGTFRREKPKAKGKSARRAERAARAAQRAILKTCPDCKIAYPRDLLASFADDDGTLLLVCGIDALRRMNQQAIAAGVSIRPRFPDGTAQESLRLKAVRYRRDHGHPE
jgi:hypothetical protein